MDGRPVGPLFAALALACACSSPSPTAPVSAPAATRAAAAAPPAPRQISGVAVALSLRRQTVAPGAEWAWLMPEARLATLAPPDSSGKRAILGPNFYVGPNGSFIGLDVSGELDLATDGAVHHLGKFDQAAFAPGARQALVWNGVEWALFSRAGERLAGDSIIRSEPLLLPSGALLLKVGASATRLVSPPESAGASPNVKFDVSFYCDAVFPQAGRLVCADRPDPGAPMTVVLSLDKGQTIARFSSGNGYNGRPRFTVRGDGRMLASAFEKVEIIELDPDKPKPSPRVIFRQAADRWRVAGRLALTRDGSRLCIEEYSETRILDTKASEWKNGGPPAARSAKDKRPMCLFARRGAEPVGPSPLSFQDEWDAVLIEAPVHEGFAEPPRRFAPHQRLETDTVSRDLKTCALLEQRPTEIGDKRRWELQAVILDAATSAVKRVIPLGEQVLAKYGTPAMPTIELSDDGALVRVCAPGVLAEGCRAYDTATGAAQNGNALPRTATARTELVTWSGEWPDAKVGEVLAALGVALEKKVAVTSWSDEGAYLSVEMDLGDGAAVHLNVPDSAQRIARDVVAVAGGSMLAIGMMGSVELWSVQPLAIRAVLVATGAGGAAFFGDGSLEAIGDVEGSLGCQKGEHILPLSECGDVRATKGTLAAVIQEASAKGSRP